jgi:hypothetical protein
LFIYFVFYCFCFLFIFYDEEMKVLSSSGDVFMLLTVVFTAYSETKAQAFALRYRFN